MSRSPSQRDSQRSDESRTSANSSDRPSSSDDETPSRSSSMPSGKSRRSTEQRNHMPLLLSETPRAAPSSSRKKSDNNLWSFPPARGPRSTVLPVDLYPKVSGPDTTAAPRRPFVPLSRYAPTEGTIPEDSEATSDHTPALLSVTEARQLQRGEFPPRQSSVTGPVRRIGTTQPSTSAGPSENSAPNRAATTSPSDSQSRNRGMRIPTSGRAWPAETPAAFSELVEALEGKLPDGRRDKIYSLDD